MKREDAPLQESPSQKRTRPVAQEAVNQATIAQLSDLIREHMGLHYSPAQSNDLERALTRAAPDFGFSGEDATRRCAERLAVGPLTEETVDILARHLTIGETYFFRDPALFEVLRHHVLPELIQARRAAGVRELRFWSAACCTGEEPYSIAMMLHSLLPTLLPDWKDWAVSILATDLNPYFLKKARGATYSAWSFRDAARDEQQFYFEKNAESRFVLKPEIRRMVHFARLNLVTDPYPSPINGTMRQDIILCRNVLMYFSPEQARLVAAGLIQCLNADGYLVPSASEASASLFAPLRPASLPGVILYKKSTAPLKSGVVASPPTILPLPFSPKKKTPPTSESRAVSKQTTARREEPRHNKTPATTTPAGNSEQAKEAEWLKKARSAAGLGRLDEALKWCDQAIAIDKMNPSVYYLRASILLERDSAQAYSEAEAALRRALYLNPDFALAHFMLGNLERRRSRPEAARRAWQNALSVLRLLPPDTPLDEGDELTAGHIAAMIERALTSLDGAHH